jgi:transposase
VEATLDNMRRIVRRIASKYDRVEFCYEAGPTGYGLHRMIMSLGYGCVVVAPPAIGRRITPSPGRYA